MSRWRDRLCWLCLPALLFSAGAAAQSTPAESGWFESAKADLRTFPNRLKEDAKATFLNGDNMAALLWVGLVSAAMNNGSADDDIAEHFAEHDTFTGFGNGALDLIGSPGCHLAGTAIWYVLSAENQDELNRQRAMTMITALMINGVVTGGLKAIRQNDQPDGDVWAWPSGHTSSSFTVASVLHEFYGLKVGIGAYTVAGLVAWRMMDAGDHWASDVVFGATLGWVVGHTVAKRHEHMEVAGFEILPYFGGRETPAVGLNLARRF